MGSLLQDIRYSLRSLRRSPLLTTVALLSLTLGIGANTAIFSLMDQALIRPLAVKDPGRLVLLSASGRRSGQINTNYNDNYAFSYPVYRDIRDRSTVFQGVFARVPRFFNLSWHDTTDRVFGDLVSGNYFEVLGVNAALGRTLTQEDDRVSGSPPVAVLSYAYWKNHFSADPQILNQKVLINGHPVTIVGVAQPGFRSVGLNEALDIFVPMKMRPTLFADGNDLENRRSHWLNIFARLKPGVSRQQAEAAMSVVWNSILQVEVAQIPGVSAINRTKFLARRLELQPGGRGISGAPNGTAAAMVVLMSMVGLLLLIACANVANLLVARATARQKEIGIRFALGASRSRVVRQLLIESMLLAVAGGLLGVLAASWTGDALLGFLPDDPSAQGLTGHPDMRVMLFAMALSLITGVIFGLLPALQSTRHRLADTLKEQSTGTIGTRGNVRFRKVLVTAQVALSLLLLIGAGLFSRSLANVKNIDSGFRPDHIISFALAPQIAGYDQARFTALCDRLLHEIAAVPGVRSVTSAQEPLLTGDRNMSALDIAGYVPKEDESMAVDENSVAPNFFETLGIPLLSGRGIMAQDNAGAPMVAVVNEVFAKRYFGLGNPLGRKILHGRAHTAIEIVGVVKDSKHADLRETSRPFVYYPYAQRPLGRVTVYTRTASEPAQVATQLRETVHRIDANLPIFDVKTMERQIDESIYLDRLVAALSVAFGALATLLAAVGLYGVMAYMVVRRTREIGIRMALGAGRRDVLGMVLREVALVAGIGIAIALVASLALGKVIGSQLFNVHGSDPAVMAAATAILALVALAAGYIPARRATRVDPLVALRYE